MKKYIALVIFACFFAVQANAQMKVKPGIRAGVNFSRFSDTDFDLRPDFYAGGFVAMKLTRFYTLQPEITYSRQGAKANFSAADGLPSDLKVGYVSFGVMNKITFNDEFSLLLGPTLDFETESNIRTNSDVDLAIMGGFGYTLPFGLTLEARAKFGVVDVLESDTFNGTDTYVDDWNTNITLQVGISYSFDAKGSDK